MVAARNAAGCNIGTGGQSGPVVCLNLAFRLNLLNGSAHSRSRLLIREIFERMEVGVAKAKSSRAIVSVLFLAIGVTALAQAQQNTMSFFVTSVGIGNGNVNGVPEPATWTMLAAGVGLLLVAKRRRLTGSR